MKADYDSQADAISIELRSFDHYDEQEEVDDDYCTVGFEKGRPVNVSLLSPAEHIELLEAAAERYDLNGVALIAITRAALSAPDRIVELKVGSRLAAA
jgi:argininosuccinate synthase